MDIIAVTANFPCKKSGILSSMAILLMAVLAFVIMRLAIRPLKHASNLKLAILALPFALSGWLLMSLVTNLVYRLK